MALGIITRLPNRCLWVGLQTGLQRLDRSSLMEWLLRDVVIVEMAGMLEQSLQIRSGVENAS